MDNVQAQEIAQVLAPYVGGKIHIRSGRAGVTYIGEIESIDVSQKIPSRPFLQLRLKWFKKMSGETSESLNVPVFSFEPWSVCLLKVDDGRMHFISLTRSQNGTLFLPGVSELHPQLSD